MADVDATHPDYDKLKPDWELVRDSLEGESAVKDKDETYLPMPSGFKAQTDLGVAMYAAYQMRAKFPEIMGPTLRGMVGIIHRVAANIQLPKQLEPLREKATKDGQTLNTLHERITYEVLATGRYGLLTDAPKEGEGELPFIAGYTAETIINWSLDSDFFVLDETHLKRTDFLWEESKQYRVLKLEGGAAEEEKPTKGGKYVQILYSSGDGGTLTEEAPIEPTMRGGEEAPEIPFVVIGPTDVSPSVDEIPLVGVARAAFAMYRLDADYKWQLFMSGQETLFVMSNSESPVVIVGAGVVINLPADSSAQYVGPSGTGINAHKEAILDERQQAVISGSRIFDTDRKAAESGDALKIRYAAQTASLTTIAINSAKGLERALKHAAMFVGANPEDVIVTPNLQFIDSALDPTTAKALMELWMGGAISGETMWENFQKGDLGSYDRTWEEERDLIDQEIPDIKSPKLAIEEKKAKDNAELMAKQPKPMIAAGKPVITTIPKLREVKK